MQVLEGHLQAKYGPNYHKLYIVVHLSVRYGRSGLDPEPWVAISKHKEA